MGNNPRWSLTDTVYEESKWTDTGGEEHCQHSFPKLKTIKQHGRVVRMAWTCKYCGLRRSVQR